MQSALFLAAKTLAAGEKILQLSTEWCEALENTRANISLNDYSQPYETMIVEFPFNYDKLRIGPGPKSLPRFRCHTSWTWFSRAFFYSASWLGQYLMSFFI